MARGGDSRMPNCLECDECVTPQYVRVFGVDGQVHGCLHCLTSREVLSGEGAAGDNSG